MAVRDEGRPRTLSGMDCGVATKPRVLTCIKPARRKNKDTVVAEWQTAKDGKDRFQASVLPPGAVFHETVQEQRAADGEESLRCRRLRFFYAKGWNANAEATMVDRSVVCRAFPGGVRSGADAGSGAETVTEEAERSSALDGRACEKGCRRSRVPGQDRRHEVLLHVLVLQACLPGDQPAEESVLHADSVMP